jgi:hypothetical protein
MVAAPFLAVLLSTTAPAAEGPFTPEQEQRIGEIIGEEVTKVTETMSAVRADILSEIAKMQNAVPGPAPVSPLTLEERVRLLEQLTENQQGLIEGLVDGTSPSIKNMQDRLHQAEQTLNRSTGTLHVRNNMATGYWLKINGTSKFFAAGTSQSMDVPAGTLITELEGYESPRNWTIGAPSFSQTIEINPRRTTLRPASPAPATPVIVNPAPPIWIDPFVYVGPTWVWDPFWGTFVLR